MKLYKIIKSKIDKTGLIATKDIKKGTKIMYYTGRLITNKEAETNPKFDKPDTYMFTLDSKQSLDGDYKSNIARLINHSCNENCEYRDSDRKTRLDVLATKNIKKGEELTADYGFVFDKNTYQENICKCGSTNCCGYIVRKGSRWRIIKDQSIKETDYNVTTKDMETI